MDIEYWSREEDLPILGMLKNPKNKKLSVLKKLEEEYKPRGFRFAYTTNKKAWKRFRITEERSYALVMFADYFENNGTQRKKGDTEIVNTELWILDNLKS